MSKMFWELDVVRRVLTKSFKGMYYILRFWSWDSAESFYSWIQKISCIKDKIISSTYERGNKGTDKATEVNVNALLDPTLKESP